MNIINLIIPVISAILMSKMFEVLYPRLEQYPSFTYSKGDAAFFMWCAWGALVILSNPMAFFFYFPSVLVALTHIHLCRLSTREVTISDLVKNILPVTKKVFQRLLK